MTVHEYCMTFTLGERKTVPTNCTPHNLIEYASSRFSYTLVIETEDGKVYLKRVCPCCWR